jgi:hypothetical protein
MTYLGGVGDFTEAVLGLAFSFGCALLMAYGCLRFLVGLMTRQQYNVTVEPNLSNDLNLATNDVQVANDPSHVRSILWLGHAVGSSSPGQDSGTEPGRDRGATGGPYVLPAAAPRNRFARMAKSESITTSRVVKLPQFARERVAQGGGSDSWGGNSGDAA